MDQDQRKSLAWTGLEAACLIAALLLYLLSLSGMASRGQSDPAGNALQAAFDVAVEFLLWLPLTAFVALRARRHGTLLAVGVVLCLAGMVLSIWALGLLDQGRWVRLAPTALPPLVMLYGLWAPFGARWPPLWRKLVLAAFIGLGAAASVSVLVAQQRWDAAAPERAAAYEKTQADYRRQEAEAAAQREAEFRALGPGSRLEQFFTWLHSDHEEEALAMIRALPSRQADAVRLLDDGDTELFEFRRMPEFGLTATSELCQSYRRRIAGKLAGFDPNDPNTNDIATELATYIDNFRWLHANGCNMADLAAREAAALRRHPNDGARADAAMFDAIR